MKFSKLSNYLSRLEKTPSRIEITKILSELFHESDPSEIDKVVYLILGSLAPSYENVVFNVAERMMLQVVALAYKKDPKDVKTLYKKMGDLGDVAATLSTKKSCDLSVAEVYRALRELAVDQGEGSQERKISAVADLLKNLDQESVRFVSRIPVGKLRLGFSDKTIIDALSWMEKGDKSASHEIEKVYQVIPDVGKLAAEVKRKGVAGLSKNPKPVVGVPVMPMLAQRLKSPVEMIEKMRSVAVEPKFDGLRVLIHFSRKKKDPISRKASWGSGHFVRAFTRNLNEISSMFPELQKIGIYLNADEVILDSEAVGLDPKTKKMVDFQKTMTRRRKHDIANSARDVPLRFQIFDVMLKDNVNMMGEPYIKRRKVLDKLIDKNNLLVVDDYIITDDSETIRNKHKELLEEGLEGVIVKKLDGKYVPGRTGWRWVKMKEVEEAAGKLADTVDVVVMGYTRGRGKRASFGVGQFLAGVVDGSKIKTITKVGTGLTDDQFKELNKRLVKLQTKSKPEEYDVHKDLEPDFWVKPSLVVELAADEITKSPKHTAELALRFPRLIKFRDDKSPKEATTKKEYVDLFKLQKK